MSTAHRRPLLCAAFTLVLAGCGGTAQEAAARHRTWAAKALIADHCGACHLVPGIAAAKGRVGPSLAGIGTQQMIAGFFANTPDNMTRWIEHPQQLLPGNAMPEMQLTHAQAQLIADYLYTLDSRT